MHFMELLATVISINTTKVMYRLYHWMHLYHAILVQMQTRNMENSKHLSQQRGQARGTDGDGRNELLPVLEGTSARQPFSVQVA